MKKMGKKESLSKMDALLEIEQRYLALMQNTMLGVAVMDTHYRVVAVNKRFCDLFKKEESEFIGKHCFHEFEKRDAICPHCPGTKALATGETTEVFTQGMLDDGNHFYAWNRAFPIYDQSGAIEGFIEIVEDITKQKVAEEEARKANEQLIKSMERLVETERVALVGQLAAGIAHEINNPTAYVSSNISALKDYLKIVQSIINLFSLLEERIQDKDYASSEAILDDINHLRKTEDLAEILEEIPTIIADCADGLLRISRIVSDLKTFADSAEGESQTANVNDLLEYALHIVPHSFPSEIGIIKRYDELPTITCYPQQLIQAFLNVIVNAIQASENKETIEIRTTFHGDRICVEIKDSGSGIAEDVLPHVFEPFYTTKPVGKGTGLGLTFTYNIIKRHKGEVAVESNRGEGAVVSIQLPVAEEG